MNMRDLDLNLLLVFEAIYSTGSISRAADRLELSQPALSNALARLRKQMDDHLFVRSGNGVVATARAEELIGPMRNALDAIRRGLATNVEFDPTTAEKHFRLLVADPLETIVAEGLIDGLPLDSRLSFELVPPQMVQIEEALLGFSLDLAVFLLPARHADLNTQPLCPLDVVVVTRNDHPRIQGKITHKGLNSERLVSLSVQPGKLRNSEKLTVWQRVNQTPLMYVHKISSIAQIASSTDLLGLIPSIYARRFADIYGLQIISPPTPLSNQQFHLVWHKRFDNDAAHVWLRNRITKAVEAANA